MELASTETVPYRMQMPSVEADQLSKPALPPAGTSKGGRKRDASRDAAILTAAIDVMVEVGYDRLTVDMVAARARAGKGAVYRRWPSKVEMVLDAVAQMKSGTVDLSDLPDTGSLRGDMLALFKPRSAEDTERLMRAIAGLAAMLAQQPDIADAGHDALIEPWVDANRILIERAVSRGEATSTVDIEVVAQVIPSFAGYRTLIQHLPFTREYLVGLLDNVVLPSLGISASANPSKSDTTGDSQ